MSTNQDSDEGQYLTAYVSGHFLGIPIEQIRDIIGEQRLTRVPLSGSSIAGILNLRGRIVTVVNMHARLDEEKVTRPEETMGIIIENHDELFSLMVDRVEDVVTISHNSIERPPPTLNSVWRGVCSGVYQVDGKIMVIIDVENILNLGQVDAA